MTHQLILQEKYSKYWPTVAILSFKLSVIIFIVYQFLDNVLLVGYLRLTAFVFFSASLLSFFKVFDGRVEITINIEDESVHSEYKVRDKIIFNDELPLSDLNRLKIDRLPNKSLYNDFMKSDKCVRFKREDESAWYYFNEIENRVIPLSEENAHRLKDFLETNSKGQSSDE